MVWSTPRHAMHTVQTFQRYWSLAERIQVLLHTRTRFATFTKCLDFYLVRPTQATPQCWSNLGVMALQGVMDGTLDKGLPSTGCEGVLPERDDTLFSLRGRVLLSHTTKNCMVGGCCFAGCVPGSTLIVRNSRNI